MFCSTLKTFYICTTQNEKSFLGEMAEWSIAAVLKTVDCNRSGGSNPSLSAIIPESLNFQGLLFSGAYKFSITLFLSKTENTS